MVYPVAFGKLTGFGWFLWWLLVLDKGFCLPVCLFFRRVYFYCPYEFSRICILQRDRKPLVHFCNMGFEAVLFVGEYVEYFFGCFFPFNRDKPFVVVAYLGFNPSPCRDNKYWFTYSYTPVDKIPDTFSILIDVLTIAILPDEPFSFGRFVAFSSSGILPFLRNAFPLPQLRTSLPPSRITASPFLQPVR